MVVLAFRRALEIGNHQPPADFEHTGDFSEPLTLEIIGQMMHHQGREYDIKRLVGEGKMLDYPDLEIDWHVAPNSFRTGAGDLLWRRVNADDTARSANVLLNFNRQRSSATAHIQHLLSNLNAGQVSGSKP